MRSAIVAALVAVVVAVVGVSGAADAQMSRREMRSALGEPAIDGVALAGMQLGWDEASAVALLGPPHSDKTSPLGDRALEWEPFASLRITVHLASGRITAIGMSIAEDPAGLPVRTARDIALGAPVSLVIERYGDAPDGRLWYAAEGIAFNPEGPAEQVRSILVFSRGTPAP